MIEENYETQISEEGLNVLLFFKLAQNNIKVSSLIGDFLINILKSNIFGGTDFKRGISVLFNQNGLIEFIKRKKTFLIQKHRLPRVVHRKYRLIVKLYEEINSLEN